MKIDKKLFWSPQMIGKTFIINDKLAIFVQDLAEQQNSNLFEEGLKLITTKVTPKRKSYIEKMMSLVLPTTDMTLDDMLRRSRDIGHIIAFVCDIALHNNKKLAHPQAYHKDFNKYVANLFQEYSLDDAYSRYIQLGDDDLAPIPEFLVSPEMKKFQLAIF